jgi:hypothetical protein
MILELERATGRLVVGAARRQADGAAPLIGCMRRSAASASASNEWRQLISQF